MKRPFAFGAFAMLGLVASNAATPSTARADSAALPPPQVTFIATNLGDGLPNSDPSHGPDITAADGIATTPVEDRPMEVRFNVWNNTTETISGFVDGAVSPTNAPPFFTAPFEIRDLPPGATAVGVLRFAAPQADTHHAIQLRFNKEHWDAEFPTYETIEWDYTEFPSAARYWFDLESLRIWNTRSVFNDTDYATVTRVRDDGLTTSYTRRLGNINNGHHNINQWSGTFDSVPHISPPTSVGFVIQNVGGNASPLGLLNFLNDVGKDIASALYPAGAASWDALNKDTDPASEFFSSQCDGPVAGLHLLLDSAFLDNQTLGPGSFYTTMQFKGGNSAPGCGSNSLYDVNWGVRRYRSAWDGLRITPAISSVGPGQTLTLRFDDADPFAGNPYASANGVPAWTRSPSLKVVGGIKNGWVDGTDLANLVYHAPANFAAADLAPEKMVTIEGTATAWVCLDDDPASCRGEERMVRAYVSLVP